MIRIVFVLMVVALESLAYAHDGNACFCCDKESNESFRETVLKGVFPLTRQVIENELPAEEFDTASPCLNKRIGVPRMELLQSLGEVLSTPINDDAPPVYFDGPTNDITSTPFDQLVENDLFPSTMAEMRVPKGVESNGSGILTFGGIAFCR